MIHLIVAINYYILFYFLVISVLYIILLAAAVPVSLLRFYETFLGYYFSVAEDKYYVPATVIVPTYNEEENIINCVESLLKSDYAALKIVIVVDGATDNTLPLLKDAYQLKSHIPIIQQKIPTAKVKRYYISQNHPNLVVIDKEHSGTGDTLNVGVNAVTTPLMMTMDADTLIEKNTIKRLMYTYLTERSSVAIGGGVYILNGCDYKDGVILDQKLSSNFVVGVQTNEYIRSFLFGRSGWNLFRGPLSFSGTCTLLDHDIVLAVGGFDLNNPAQDAEIIVKIQRYIYENNLTSRVIFTPAAITWTQVPDTLMSFAKQRINWQYGILRTFIKHIRMFFNPKYHIVAFVNFPFYLLIEAFGPMVELTTYLLIILSIIFGVFSIHTAALFFILSLGFIAFISVATMSINILTFNRYRKLSDVVRIFFYTIFELIGFRQFLLVSQGIGTFKYLFVTIKNKLFKMKNKHGNVSAT